MLIVLICFLNPLNSIEILSRSPSSITVRKGEVLELFCKASSHYQWCYWEHNTLKYLTTAPKDFEEVIEATDLGFLWKKTNTKCGLIFENATVQHAGTWKCQLANTDARHPNDIR